MQHYFMYILLLLQKHYARVWSTRFLFADSKKNEARTMDSMKYKYRFKA